VTKRKAQHEFKLTKQQILLGIHLDELGVRFQREFKFCERDWRFDIILLDYRIGIEISGGNFSGGHRRFKAQEDEYNKLNTATVTGWKVLQFTNYQVECGHARAFLKHWLGGQS